MPILTGGDIARIDGAASVEEAETLVAFLEGAAGRRVDLSAASHLHTAVLQVLMAYRPPATALPGDPDLNALLAPVLAGDDPTMTDAA